MIDHTIPAARHLLFLGLSRTGSTWFEQCLRGDDRFALPQTKDLFFFDQYFDRGIDWYLDRYESARPSQVLVDVGHDYFVGPWVLDRIDSTLQDWRGVVLLREPVAWLNSQIRFGIRSGKFDQSQLERGDYHDLVELVNIAPFDRLVEFWKRRAGDRLLVAPFDDLRDRPEQLLADVARLCGIEGDAVEPVVGKVNVAMHPRSVVLHRLARSVVRWSRDREIRYVEQVIKSDRARTLAHRSEPVEFELPGEFMNELRSYWSPGVHRLDQWIPGVAQQWGYRESVEACSDSTASATAREPVGDRLLNDESSVGRSEPGRMVDGANPDAAASAVSDGQGCVANEPDHDLPRIGDH